VPSRSFPSPDGRFRFDIVMPEVDSPDARAEIAIVDTASGESILDLIGPPILPAAMFAGNQLHLALGNRAGRSVMVVIDLDARMFRLPGDERARPLSDLAAALPAALSPPAPATYQPPEPIPVPVNAGPYLCASHRPLPAGWRAGREEAWAAGRYGLEWATFDIPEAPGFMEACRIVEHGSDDVVLDLIGTFWDVRIEFVDGTSDLLKVSLARRDAPGVTRTVFIALDVEKFWPDLGPGPHPEAVRDLDELHQELVADPAVLTGPGPAPRVRPSKMRPEIVLRRGAG
jgi:hypothetical protein